MNTTSEILDGYNGCKCNGGGGGDFSTAMVTITLPEGNEMGGTQASISVDDSYAYVAQIDNAPNTHIVLYKGSATVSGVDSAEVTVSGDAEITEQTEDSGDWYFSITVTGDFTLNLTGYPLG